MADNGPCIGIEKAHFDGPDALLARADDYSLEDVVTHVLRNAERYRLQESPITITLAAGDTGATITIHNQVPPIAPEMIGNIFEYGVSDKQNRVPVAVAGKDNSWPRRIWQKWALRSPRTISTVV
ncbi:signal transduction histidine kinase [Duganella sp. 3397]|uniref:ATP-binding protein n=1 Tax=Duganella sp. 3397 TaxID=2817732 RepID=UPI00285E93DC|nr:ATP-binding protein [Duganella sp. 3397]MDR7052650.1 signal transduction histidine kinase [Duganella sp. 3397]